MNIQFKELPDCKQGYNLFMRVNPFSADATCYWIGSYYSKFSGKRRSQVVHITENEEEEFLLMQLKDWEQYSAAANCNYRIYKAVEIAAMADNQTGLQNDHFAIVKSCIEIPDFYRVVNLWDAQESSLYSLEECREIIQHYFSGELKGSFGTVI